MRLIYLCTIGSTPSDSDFSNVLDFLKPLPEYLQPRTSENNSPNMLYFADRIGSNWFPEFHDFAIVFLSETLLTNEKALSCLSRAKTAFPNMIGIDLYNNLSSKMMEKAKQYCKLVFSFDDGKEFLLTTFLNIAAMFDLESKELTESIETDGYKYLDETIEKLKKREKVNQGISFACYVISLVALSALIVLSFRYFDFLNHKKFSFDLSKTIILCIEMLILSALAISTLRFLFLLGKSFMVEAIRCADRAHAIGLGKLYLKLFKDKFRWEELRDVLQSWNIDKGSAFINLDAKDIEGVSLDRIASIVKDK